MIDRPLPHHHVNNTTWSWKYHRTGGQSYVIDLRALFLAGQVRNHPTKVGISGGRHRWFLEPKSRYLGHGTPFLVRGFAI
jgi:hypothetical protein